MMRRWGGLIVLLVLAAGLWLARAPLGEALYGRIAATRAGRDALAGDGDGLTLIFCGTGTPLPDPDRAEACLAVKAGNTLLLIDAGDGGVRKLASWGVQLGGLDGVLLTHLHSDHVEGLAPALLLRWTGSAARTPLPLIGPPGTAQVAEGYNLMLAADAGYRTAHHGEAIAPTGGGRIAGRDAEPGVVWNRDGLVITAFAVNHAPVAPAWGYRIAYKGRVVVVSGDTAASPAVANAAKGADLLVHEALQPRLVAGITRGLEASGQPRTAQITRDILTYHTTPEQAASLAAEAGVGQLVLTHIAPPLPSRLFHAAFLGDAPQRFGGPILIASDGLRLFLPAGSRAVEDDHL
ncbi:MBL fold metallo-hydrolase [Sandarakinorhabdus rubra]|uniref:MBL fold metallo-hydrolase n=1 Tax=Sandarakinorhabdus rubra TaxID=2672568 RepID=UPI0013DA7D3C|nr:MBL fold metallo-hydrolase [Sandarakinorhabdus rubra]